MKVTFDKFHLEKSMYERCAREGGMKGTLDRRTVMLPAEGTAAWEGIKALVGAEGGAWERFKELPYFGVLVIAKE